MERSAEAVKVRIAELYAEHGSLRKVAAISGHAFVTVRKYHLYGHEATSTPEAAPEAVELDQQFSVKETEDKAEVSYSCEERIRTMEDAVRFAEVDQTVWFVSGWECGSYEVVMRVRRGKGIPDLPTRKTLWRVKLVLKRIWPRAYQQASEALFERLAQYSPALTESALVASGDEPHVLVMGLFDAHFGKLAWAPETGDNYDLRIAETVYANAVADLIHKARGFPIGRVVMPIGNDFYHIDNTAYMTTGGTPQDADGRYAKIIATGEMAVIRAIDRLAGIAPVEVTWVPGNHDRLASYHLTRTLAAYYRNTDRVDVNLSPAERKYVRYGTNLIGLTHGNEEKHASLPAIMATERATDWAETTCHEWLLGHLHKSRKTETVSVDTHDGVTVRILRSLSGTDAWHFRKGYVGSQRAAEALLMGCDSGYSAHFQANVRTT